MRVSSPTYVDREHAGRVLAAALSDMRIDDPVVVGLARGGVEVASVVADRLGCPLGALPVRKVHDPNEPEFAFGAVASGVVYVRRDAHVRPERLAEFVDAAQARAKELGERIGSWSTPLAGNFCVLVDDGLATGATMIVAIRWARQAGAARVVAAAPIATRERIERLELEADIVVCPLPVVDLRAVGLWYDVFDQVDDARVVELLERARRRVAGPTV